MKTVRIHGPKDFRLDEVGDPTLGAGDALVRVKACGVCGSDLAYIDMGHAGFRGGTGGPSALGHEAAGEIVALGSDVAGLAVGDRVAINPIDYQGMTAIGNGAPEGAFADILCVRNVTAGGRLLKLPEGLDYEVAALMEPMGVALHTVNRSGAHGGSKVVVLGVGPIGLGVVIWLKQRGAHVIAVDLSAERLERARRFGADGTLLGGSDTLEQEIAAIHGTGRRGAPDTDIYIDAAGSAPALTEILRIAKFGATVTLVAIHKKPVPLDLSAMLHKEIILTTSMGYPDELEDVVAFLGRNRDRMTDYISDRFPLDAIETAVDRARHPDSAKVMVCI